MASFLGWHKASLLSQTLLPFIYPSMLPHPSQDPVRMSRIKYRGSQVFIKHIAFQLVSKIKQTHLGLFKAPFLTFLHYFKGIGACAFATWHAQPNCDPFLSKPSIFLLQFCQVFPIPRNRNSECGRGCRFLAQEVVQMLFLKEDDYDCLCE